jgi:PRTRC genetic system protein B
LKTWRIGRNDVQVHISIGENHRFELREALLIYGDRQRSFVTRHAVVHQKEGPPTLEPAQPLTLAFLESLTRSLSGSFPAEILSETVLAKGERMIVWWTPACRRKMFYENAEGKGAALNGKVFAQPSLVWHVENGELRIRAIVDNKRPTANTKLCVAPFWNLADDGRVCIGTMRHPESATAASIPDWERGFYESGFTHANIGRLTRHPGGFEELWGELTHKRKPFPTKTLISLPETLAQFVRGARG